MQKAAAGPLPSWRLFAIKAVVLTLILGAVSAYATDRFRLAIDAQSVPCLDGARVMIVDTYDLSPAKGAVMAFRARDLGPVIADGTLMGKLVTGIPGDKVTVTTRDVRVNGRLVGQGLDLAGRLRRPPESFERTLELPAGRYWMMGTAAESFDSRYWGTIGQDQLVGRAYRLL